MTIKHKPLVISADWMTSESFVRHMNKRHHDSLGGLTNLVLRYTSRYVEECWRRFHDRLHAVRVDLGHEHNDSWE